VIGALQSTRHQQPQPKIRPVVKLAVQVQTMVKLAIQVQTVVKLAIQVQTVVRLDQANFLIKQ